MARTTRGPTPLLITCEHGGNEVPPQYRPLFRSHRELLASHRGYDPGTLLLAGELADHFRCGPIVSATTTRLLVDLNRSTDNRSLFSEITRSLSDAERLSILRRYYLPYRRRVAQRVERLIEKGGRVCHLSVHSFTPVLAGKVRTTDVGLLFDPAREEEHLLCDAWRWHLRRAPSAPRVKFNYPYRGTSDGLTTNLRTRLRRDEYVGVELEVNQEWVGVGGGKWSRLRKDLAASLARALGQIGWIPT